MIDIHYIRSAFKIDQDSSLPLYKQFERFIRLCIASGLLGPGDRLPPELELCEASGLSRPTIRTALSLLSRRGILLRRRGLGSFVKPGLPERDFSSMYSFSAEMGRIGRESHSEILEAAVVPVDAEGADRLGLESDQALVFSLARTRYVDGRPVLLEWTQIPSRLCPGIDKFDFSRVSFHATLAQEYAIVLAGAVETLETVPLDAETAGILGTLPGAPAIRIERIGRDETGTVFEYTESFIRGDSLRLRFELDRTTCRRTSVPVVRKGR